MPATNYIRRYRPVDHEGLLAFLDHTLQELGREFLPDGKDADIRDLDRVYLKDRGFFHVVDHEGKICGCVGVRKFSNEVADLKRLYLGREFYGLGLGQALCTAAIEDARGSGYKSLRLATTAKSQAAVALFGKLGFHEIPRYNSDPFAEIFMEKLL